MLQHQKNDTRSQAHGKNRRFGGDTAARARKRGLRMTPAEKGVNRVNQFVKSISIVVKHHNCPKRVVLSMRDQVVKYLTGTDELTFLKRAKYILLLPMAMLLKNDLPPSPDEIFRFSGKFWRWMRPRVKIYSKRNVHLWYSFLQAKRGAAPVSDDVVQLNYREHREKLTQPDPLFSSQSPAILLEMLSSIGGTMKWVTKKLVAQKRTLLRPETHMAAPKTSACLESGRGTGGSKAYLQVWEGRTAFHPRVYSPHLIYGPNGFDTICDKNHLVQEMFVSSNRDVTPGKDKAKIHFRRSIPIESVVPSLVRIPELMGMRECRRSKIKDDLFVEPSVEEIRFVPPERQYMRRLIDSLRPESYHENFRNALGTLGIDYKQEAFETNREVILTAAIQGVIEPFKVRVISKGPAMWYDTAKPFQEKIHTVLRNMPAFRLIGRPFDVLDIMDLRKAHEDIFGPTGPDFFWISGDYVASTDGLSINLSREILEGLIGWIRDEDPALHQVLSSVLDGHRLVYPDGSVATQTNGQLMGSILSFPILCLANLALYLTVKRRLNPTIPISKLLKSVLINGDDILYIGTKAEWELHQELGKDIGLKMSPGKAYIHHSYANINSVSIDYDLRKRSNPTVLPFFNVGLFVGNNKVMDRVDDGGGRVGDLDSTISVMNELLRGCWNEEKRVETLKQYLSFFSKEIKREARGRNLFLPTSLGGCGVTKPKNFKNRLTFQQLYAASRKVRKFLFTPAIYPRPDGWSYHSISDTFLDPFESPMPSKLPKVGNFKRTGWSRPKREILLHGIERYLQHIPSVDGVPTLTTQNGATHLSRVA